MLPTLDVTEMWLKVNNDNQMVRLLIAEFDACQVTFVVSLSEAERGGTGIIRGDGLEPPYMIDPFTGELLVNPRDLRKYTKLFMGHCDEFADATGIEPLAAVSLGDAGKNARQPVYRNDKVWKGDGLFFTQQDTPLIQKDYHFYAIVQWRNDVVTAERVLFSEPSQGARVIAEDGRDITDEVKYVLCGPAILWDGEPVHDPTQFCDLRHLFSMIDVQHDGKRILVGEHAMVHDQKFPELLTEAYSGEAIRIPLTIRTKKGAYHISPDAVRWTAKQQGYEEVPTPKHVSHPGQFWVNHHDLVVSLLPGVYPRNALGVKSDGTLVNLIATGCSTKAGITLAELQDMLLERGVVAAITLDEGADCQFALPLASYWLPSFNGRMRVSGAILFIPLNCAQQSLAIRFRRLSPPVPIMTEYDHEMLVPIDAQTTAHPSLACRNYRGR